MSLLRAPGFPDRIFRPSIPVLGGRRSFIEGVQEFCAHAHVEPNDVTGVWCSSISGVPARSSSFPGSGSRDLSFPELLIATGRHAWLRDWHGNFGFNADASSLITFALLRQQLGAIPVLLDLGVTPPPTLAGDLWLAMEDLSSAEITALPGLLRRLSTVEGFDLWSRSAGWCSSRGLRLDQELLERSGCADRPEWLPFAEDLLDVGSSPGLSPSVASALRDHAMSHPDLDLPAWWTSGEQMPPRKESFNMLGMSTSRHRWLNVAVSSPRVAGEILRHLPPPPEVVELARMYCPLVLFDLLFKSRNPDVQWNRSLAGFLSRKLESPEGPGDPRHAALGEMLGLSLRRGDPVLRVIDFIEGSGGVPLCLSDLVPLLSPERVLSSPPSSHALLGAMLDRMLSRASSEEIAQFQSRISQSPPVERTRVLNVLRGNARQLQILRGHGETLLDLHGAWLADLQRRVLRRGIELGEPVRPGLQSMHRPEAGSSLSVAVPDSGAGLRRSVRTGGLP